MKKVIALLLACAMALTGCKGDNSNINSTSQTNVAVIADVTTTSSTENDTTQEIQNIVDNADLEFQNIIPEYDSLSDPDLIRYVEDSVYDDIVTQLNSEGYFVENVQGIYISKEYIDELEYNSQSNIFFGYTLNELEEQFQGSKFVFTLGDDGATTVKELEEYDDTLEQVIKNVAIGTGVILLCVTVSVVTGGVGAAAVSMIFAASAKTAATFAVSSAVMGGVGAGIAKGIETKDFDEAMKAAALAGSEGFKWGAITGAVAGGAAEAIALKGATLNGLTMNQAATIQKESKYPLDVIKQFKNMDQYDICKKAGLVAKKINGKTALVRPVDLNYVDEATGLTNLQRMQKGLAALDSKGNAYELHHIGQHADSTLALLTQEEHRLGDSYSIWHELVGESEIDRKAFDLIRKDFWKSMAKALGA